MGRINKELITSCFLLQYIENTQNIKTFEIELNRKEGSYKKFNLQIIAAL
jgi:hypothetical protein